MQPDRLEALVREADELLAAEPSHFDPPAYNQPGSAYVNEAEALLGDDAPWHRVAHVAHALRAEDEPDEQ